MWGLNPQPLGQMRKLGEKQKENKMRLLGIDPTSSRPKTEKSRREK